MDEQTEVEQQALQYAAENEDLIWTYLFSRTVRDICSEQKNGGPWGNEPPRRRGTGDMLWEHRSSGQLFMACCIAKTKSAF